MANVTITVTDTQAAVLPLYEDADGKKETVKQFCQRKIDEAADTVLSRQRQSEFAALTGTRQDQILAVEKS